MPAATPAEVGGAVGDAPVADLAVGVAVATPTATATITSATPTVTPSAPLTAQVASTPALTSVNRIGVNLSGNDYSSASDYMQNMFDNPGFEPITDAHLIVIGSGATSTTFTDGADPGTKSNGYWVGATASVRTAQRRATSSPSPVTPLAARTPMARARTQLAAAFPVRRWRRAWPSWRSSRARTCTAG